MMDLLNAAIMRSCGAWYKRDVRSIFRILVLFQNFLTFDGKTLFTSVFVIELANQQLYGMYEIFYSRVKIF